VHYSIPPNHLHLIIEATDTRTMRSGVSGLVIAFAKRLNRILDRARGRTWRERFHSRELTTPSEVRNALVYVLQNFKKHGARSSLAVIDHFSSALRFIGWSAPVAPPTAAATSPSPSRAPRTWLLAVGWTRLGLISPHESPA
jgi:hypothetical protein